MTIIASFGTVFAHSASFPSGTWLAPFTIGPEALLDDAQKAFKEHKVDTLSVSENGKQLGMLDIQDLMKAISA